MQTKDTEIYQGMVHWWSSPPQSQKVFFFLPVYLCMCICSCKYLSQILLRCIFVLQL